MKTATATATALTMVTSTTSKRPPLLLGLVFVVLINTSANSFANEIKLSDLRPNGSYSQNIVLPPPPPLQPKPPINVVPIPALSNQQPNQVFIQYQNPASGVSAGAHIWNHSPSGQSGGNAQITFPLPGGTP